MSSVALCFFPKSLQILRVPKQFLMPVVIADSVAAARAPSQPELQKEEAGWKLPKLTFDGLDSNQVVTSYSRLPHAGAVLSPRERVQAGIVGPRIGVYHTLVGRES